MVCLQFVAHDGTFDSHPVWLNVTLTEEEKVDLNGDLNNRSSSTNSTTAIHCQANSQVEIYSRLAAESRENNARIDTFPHTPPEELDMTNLWTPTFTTDFPAIVTVEEDKPVGHQVGPRLLSALDADYRYNSWLRFSASSEGDYFAVTPLGQIVLARPLDRETRTLHTVNVTVQDAGSPPRSSSLSLLVRVLDKNDNSTWLINTELVVP